MLRKRAEQNRNHLLNADSDNAGKVMMTMKFLPTTKMMILLPSIRSVKMIVTITAMIIIWKLMMMSSLQMKLSPLKEPWVIPRGTLVMIPNMYSHRDPSIRKNGTANTFIENLDKTIDHKALHDAFSTFGHILSCKIAIGSSGQSNSFVQFDIEESAQNAIDKLNDPDSGNSGPIDCGVLGKWTVGSDFWWRKLSSLCRGSCCSPYEWTLS